MTTKLKWAAVAALATTLVACGGNSTLDDDEAPVFLTAEVEEFTPDVDVAFPFDVVIGDLVIENHPKDPFDVLTPQSDVRLRRWVVTPYRTDGGTTASPVWQNAIDVYVPVGGSADLENYRMYPNEFFGEEPLVNLFPENGGYDPETGNRNIRQAFRVEIFGETVGGKDVKVEFTVGMNFYYETY